jgi:DNA recombination protein RmuC
MDGSVLVVLVLGLAVGAAVGLALARRRSPGAGTADLPRLEAALQARFEAQAAELRRLADAGAARSAEVEALRTQVGEARIALERLVTQAEERAERERENWQVVQRVAAVLAGGASAGRAGENVLREHLQQLPPGMLVTDLRVNGKVVEFALQLPDGRWLPIDSKWSALDALEALEAAEDPAEREAMAREVEKAVSARVREVVQYLNPSLTAPVAVAAVPDAAYAVLRRAHADAFAQSVIVVPYSTALPVLLFLYTLVARYGDAGDVRAALQEVAQVMTVLEGLLENRFARAAVMLTNGTDEMRAQLGKARASIARGTSAAAAGEEGTPPALEALP